MFTQKNVVVLTVIVLILLLSTTVWTVFGEAVWADGLMGYDCKWGLIADYGRPNAAESK